MSTQKYSVAPHQIDTLLSWVKSGEIAIPEIQRPFVWEPVKVRNLLDSLYAGFPVGYLITWRNPTVRLKDGTYSAGKRILIDGQQRVTALMAALLGRDVLTKDYETTRITIAFNPVEEKFEVANPAIEKNAEWIGDVSSMFGADADFLGIVDAYATANPSVDRKQVGKILQRLTKITGNNVGVIELAEDLDIETVTEIFIRVNSAGVTLSQADFAMSKIAANMEYGGARLRKAIDYFCHLAKAPDQFARIEKADLDFAKSDFWPKIIWLKDANDDLYDPSYTDILRVAFTSRFERGRLQDLVALLSGRNFETKTYEADIAEQSFATLKEGVLDFINKTHFDRITMILRSAGLVINDLIGSQNAVNFAYILYLKGRALNLPAAELESLVRRWYAMSVLRGRYAGAPEVGLRPGHTSHLSSRVAKICKCGCRLRTARILLDGHAAAVDGYVFGDEPLFPGLSRRSGEAGRQGLLVQGHHRARFAAQSGRRPPRVPAEPPEEAGSATRALQSDRELRRGPVGDQHQHRRRGTEQGFCRTTCPGDGRSRSVWRHHGPRDARREPDAELHPALAAGRRGDVLRRISD